MAESNGSLKTANGHGNGQRKQTNIRSRQASKRSRGFISWFTNHIGRYVASHDFEFVPDVCILTA